MNPKLPTLLELVILIAMALAVPSDVATYDAPNRWTATQTNGAIPLAGMPVVLTWSIVPDSTPIPPQAGAQAGVSDLQAYMISNGGEAAWTDAIAGAFESWSVLAGITFVQVSDPAGFPAIGTIFSPLSSGPDIRISGRDFGVQACVLSAKTNAPPPDGDITINTNASGTNGSCSQGVSIPAFVSNGGPSDYFRKVMMHEIGHSLGLEHVCPPTIPGSKLMESAVTPLYFGPQLDDERGVQRSYGDKAEPNGTQALATGLGTLGNGIHLFPAAIVSIPNTNGLTAQPHFGLSSTLDVDWFRFTVNDCRRATIKVLQFGTSYSVGAASSATTCNNPVLLNALDRLVLHVQVQDAAGIQQPAIASYQPLSPDHSATILNYDLHPGDHLIRVTGTIGQDADDVQLYSLQISLSALPGPTAPSPNPPAILLNPPSSVVCPMAGIELSVNATGGALTYQWRHGGTIIPGATGSSLQIPAFTMADIGSYDCMVTNYCTQVTSNSVSLTMGSNLLSVDQPQGAGSLRVINRCAEPGRFFFTAFTFDPANPTPPGGGWWGGLHIPPNELFYLLILALPMTISGPTDWDLPPFRSHADATGGSVFQIGPGALSPNLSGLRVTAVSLEIDFTGLSLAPETFSPLVQLVLL